jgi:hypothetical protein
VSRRLHTGSSVEYRGSCLLSLFPLARARRFWRVPVGYPRCRFGFWNPTRFLFWSGCDVATSGKRPDSSRPVV